MANTFNGYKLYYKVVAKEYGRKGAPETLAAFKYQDAAEGYFALLNNELSAEGHVYSYIKLIDYTPYTGKGKIIREEHF